MGKHSTKAVEAHSWKEYFFRFQKPKILNPAWDARPNPVDSFDDGIEEMIRALEDIPEQLNFRPESVPLSMKSFANLLKEQIALIRVERDR